MEQLHFHVQSVALRLAAVLAVEIRASVMFVLNVVLKDPEVF